MPGFAQTRTIVIDAQPAAIRPFVDDFHEWPQWSAWEKIDPNMKRTYSGAESGVGAKYGWDGDKKAGSGSMEVLTSTPERVEIALSFLKPFKATNTTTVEFVPEGAATRVNWTMSGQRNIVFAVLGPLFFDKVVAGQIDEGLGNLKRVVEQGSPA